MGKGSRLKAERAAAAAANPHADLAAAAEVIGYSYGAHADCAAVAAILQITGGALGYELTPRPVSVLIRQVSTNDIAFMGPRATSLIPESDFARVEEFREGGRDTGHMVVTAEEPTVLLDANLGQLRSHGFSAPDSLMLSIASTQPESGIWIARPNDLEVTYMPDDNDALWERYAAAQDHHRGEALQLAEMIKARVPVARIKAGIRPRA